MFKRSPVVFVLLVLLTAMLACNFVTGAGTGQGPTVENLHMAFDEDGNNPTTTFAPTDIFYVVGDLKNAPAGTIVDAKWLAAQIEDFEPDELIYEQSINDFADENFSGTIYFQLSNDSEWPAGEYKVEIFVDGNLVGSVPFSVQ